MDRYYVDNRIGCIAVCDRNTIDPEYPGLHEDTQGVIKFWMKQRESTRCPTCGQSLGGDWVDGQEVNEANQLAKELNSEIPRP